jgi:hypothetical protein
MKAGIRIYFAVTAGALTVVAFVCGCGNSGGSPSASTTSGQHQGGNYAGARLHSLAGSGASGTAVYRKRSGRYSVTVTVNGLKPTRTTQQYALWQLEEPQDRTALDATADMVSLATYRVGGGRLEEEFEPPLRAYEGVSDGRLTHFLITLIDSPESLQSSIVQFDETGQPPDLGRPIAEGTLSGPLMGAP